MANSASLISSAFSIAKPPLNKSRQLSPSALSISRNVVTSLRRNPNNFTGSRGKVARYDSTLSEPGVLHGVNPPAAVHIWPISLFTKIFGGQPRPQTTIVVDEKAGMNFNQTYESVEIYLRSIIREKSRKYRVSLDKRNNTTVLSMVENDVLVDTYKNIQLEWRWRVVHDNLEGDFLQKRRYFELTCDSEHEATMRNEYLPYVLEKAKEINSKEWCPKLYTRGDGGHWMYDKLYHRRTFDKLAMEPELKSGIIDELDVYLKAEEVCKKVGIFVKRRFLLYGPPGTGKSSLIEMMANYLKFDIYNLKLANLTFFWQLSKSLQSTTTESIVVINGIDGSAMTLDGDSKPKSSQTELTFSESLNIMDELGDSWAHGRIVIFTMNHHEKIDPALLGRVDMHIHMSYCSPPIFDELAYIYLGISDHSRFPEIKGLMEGLRVTPAEIVEPMIESSDPEMALAGVVDLLQSKRAEAEAEAETIQKNSGSGTQTTDD